MNKKNKHPKPFAFSLFLFRKKQMVLWLIVLTITIVLIVLQTIDSIQQRPKIVTDPPLPPMALTYDQVIYSYTEPLR